MAYAPRIVANAFLRKAREAGVRLTHMQVQKLVFFLHAWALALRDGKSYLAEEPEAWPYGPVFDSLYHELKEYGPSPIDGLIRELDPAAGKLVAMVPSPQDEGFYRLLDQVWDRYGRFTALQLSTLSHEPGGPWEKARQQRLRVIPSDWIRDHYRGKLTPA